MATYLLDCACSTVKWALVSGLVVGGVAVLSKPKSTDFDKFIRARTSEEINQSLNTPRFLGNLVSRGLNATADRESMDLVLFNLEKCGDRVYLGAFNTWIPVSK